MPIRFPCAHCEKILKVSSSKAGKKAKCPNCQGPLTVPTVEEAAKLMTGHRDEPDGPAVSGDASEPDQFAATTTAPAENPFSEFVVYDDEDTELVYETAAPRVRDQRPIDYDRVAVPRYVLYVQGALLGIVGLVCFTLGIVIGGMTDSGPGEAEIRGPFFVSGAVQYKTGEAVDPDSGAVVVVLPKDANPEPKATVSGLRPADLGQDPTLALRPLHEIGGGYARADAQGNFQVSVPGPGHYFVLVISANARRDDAEPLAPEDNARVGRYFDESYRLIGEQKYRLSEQNVKQDQTLNVIF